jgi:hypothetical protein
MVVKSREIRWLMARIARGSLDAASGRTDAKPWR